MPEGGEWTLTCGFDWSYHEKAVLDLDERKLRTHFKEVASPDVDFNVWNLSAPSGASHTNLQKPPAEIEKL